MDVIEVDIKKILPTVDNQTVRSIVQRLVDLGVSDSSHLELLEESDLLPVMKTIQARLLIKSWKNNDKMTCMVPEEKIIESPSDKVQSIIQKEKNSEKMTTNLDWAFNFEIPWGDMPGDLMKALKENKRPAPGLRREMVRIVTSAIQNIASKPGRKALSIIARKMVKEYSSSLTDLLCGEIVGEGHSSLLKQLELRFDNLNRGNSFNVLKRSIKDNSDGKRKKLQTADHYGCINWQPSNLPIYETEESQTSKKDRMLEMSISNQRNFNNDMKNLLKDTYYSVRKDINSGHGISSLKKEWPLLFSEEGIFQHFEMLVGIDVFEKINDSLAVKGARLFKFLKVVPCKTVKGKKMIEFLDSLDASQREDPDLSSLISLLMLYFDEDIRNLFIAVDVTVTAEEIENVELPYTPCIIYNGEDVRNATYTLIIDGKVAVEDIKTFIKAFTLMFAAYYCFNIHYPKAASTTLEFVQRCFLGINPNRGSKVDPKKKKEVLNAKILGLLNKLSDFEWSS